MPTLLLAYCIAFLLLVFSVLSVKWWPPLSDFGRRRFGRHPIAPRDCPGIFGECKVVDSFLKPLALLLPRRMWLGTRWRMLQVNIFGQELWDVFYSVNSAVASSCGTVLVDPQNQ